MLTLADATRLIDGSADPAVRARLLAALGFHGPALRLDADAVGRLGLPPAVMTAEIMGEEGLLRALIVTLEGTADVRDGIGAIARCITRRVPHLSWLIVAVQHEGDTLAVGTWHTPPAGIRVTALVTTRGRVVTSDAETLCALAAATDGAGGDVMRHLRWLDVLGREAIARRFFRALERSVTTLAQSLAESPPQAVPAATARELALLTTSRLLFLAFLEAKGWLAGDFGFLANGFAACMASGGSYHRRVLEPLFFGTLNTSVRRRAERARAFGRIPFLNGGLFARSALERLHRHTRFSDDALGDLFGDVLVRHRFTPREDAGDWSETAIDPEILGKAFECLMAPADRKRHGVHFTPQPFVERLTRLTLGTALACESVSAERVDVLLAGSAPNDGERAALRPRVETITILDPACGSGAFLVHVMERLASLRVLLGDTRPLAEVRRTVLTHCIFGADVNPTAVWLCELRLWLSAVIDSDERDPMRVVPLPNLDHNIRVGDSLAGVAFPDPASGALERRVESASLGALRQRYTRAVGPRKASLGRVLDREERTRAVREIERRIVATRAERREIVAVMRTRDLFATRHSGDPRSTARLAHLRATHRALCATRTALRRSGALPFSYASHFSDVAERGGFRLVIGNPPWVRFGNIAPEERERYRHSFRTVSHAAWRDGADEAGAAAGFAGQTDLSALFVERARDLLAPAGTLGFLLPAKLWRSLSGGGCRRLLTEDMRVEVVEDCSDAPSAFEAAVYPSMLVARRMAASGPVASTISGAISSIVSSTVCGSASAGVAPLLGVHRRGAVTQWRASWRDVALDGSPGSPWMFLPPESRAAFDRMERAGVPLSRTAFGRPWLGVKSGCNAAFVVHRTGASGDMACVTNGERTGDVEIAMLRPLVRGETLTPWRFSGGTEQIVWPHDADGAMRALPPGAARWLAVHRRTLERRSDARGNVRWWSLFRTESADPARSRVVWSDFGRRPRAAVLAAGDPLVPLNTCYVVACPSHHDALALAALFNSPLAAAWLAVLAEPARGGYRRYLGWTMARFPVPTDWPRARALLAPLAESALRDDIPTSIALQRAALAAYRMRPDALAALLEWTEADG